MQTHIYPSQYTHNKVSVLPIELQEICNRRKTSASSAKYAIVDSANLRGQFSILSSKHIIQIEADIRNIASFHSFYYESAFVYEGRSPIAKIYPKELAVLKTYPELSYLYLFHGNGWLRQAALDNLNYAPTCSFEIAAIVHRLNDWVPQVRDAALNCCQRLFGSIPPNIAAQTSPYILEKLWVYKRWGEAEKNILKEFVFKPDVISSLAKILRGQGVGNIGSICRLAFQRAGLECHLEELAFCASQPIVRSIAYQVLLSKRVSWPTGFKRIWIDRSAGKSQLEIALDSRPISHDIDIEFLLEKGAADRAVVVRRVVAQELINRLPSCSPKAVNIAEQFLSDKSQSVRTRAEYFLKHSPTKSPT